MWKWIFFSISCDGDLHFGTLHAMMSLERFATPKGRAGMRGFSNYVYNTPDPKHRKGEHMKSLKSSLIILTAVLLGMALGAFLSRPPRVQASAHNFYVQKVEEGRNTNRSLWSTGYIGFACTQTDCYIASTE
jgi:hypothetical protein